jgi:hypothetical protein
MKTYLISDEVVEAIAKGIISEEEAFFMYDITKRAELNLDSVTKEERSRRKEILKRYNDFIYG